MPWRPWISCTPRLAPRRSTRGAVSTAVCATCTPPLLTSGSRPTTTSWRDACCWAWNPARRSSESTTLLKEKLSMDAFTLLMQRYDPVHKGFVPDLFKNVTDEQVRQRPSGLNSVAWLVWHLSRVQDAVVSRFLDDRAQVLDEGRWNEAMGLDRRDVGPGMTGDEVAALSARIDVDALRRYHGAVAERHREIAASLPSAAWDEVVPGERVRKAVAAEAMLLPPGQWVADFWARGHSRGWYLLQVALLHPYGHCFDAMVTRGQLGVPEN